MFTVGPVASLWGIGVGSVIGGTFFGWTPILNGGFGCGLLSITFMTIFYSILARSTSLLVSLFGAKCGSFSYVRASLGPRAGFLVAALELTKLVFVLTAVGFGTVSYLSVFFNHNKTLEIVAFAVLYCFFGLANLFGKAISGTIQFYITVGCLLILLFYWILVAFHFDLSKYAIEDMHGRWFTGNLDTFASSLPFAAWMFIGFEEIPIIHSDAHADTPANITSSSASSASSPPTFEACIPRASIESHPFDGIHELHNLLHPPTQARSHSQQKSDGSRVLQMALVTSLFTISSISYITVTMSVAGPPGISSLIGDASPLVSCLDAQYGASDWRTSLVSSLSAVALSTPLFSFTMFTSHYIHKLAELGILPSFIVSSSLNSAFTTQEPSSSHSNSPVVSLIIVVLLCFIISFAMRFQLGLDLSAEVLVGMCLFPTMGSYLVQIISLQWFAFRSRAAQLSKSERSLRLGILVENFVAEVAILIVLFCVVYSSTSNMVKFQGLMATIGIIIVLYLYMLRCSQRSQRFESGHYLA